MTYDYIITKPELNEETLAHYGVLGMKWGVRKAKWEAYKKDKAKKRTAKKINRIKKYKDRKMNTANSRASDFDERRKAADRDRRDLQKYGKNSNTYKLWEANEREKARNSYAIRHPGENYNTSSARMFDDLTRSVTSKQNVAKLIENNKNNSKIYKERSEYYQNAANNLKNLKINEKTKRKDIRKAYRNK